MHVTSYPEGWTRRHFIEHLARGVVAAGVLAPLFDTISRHGDCAAAYPPELLSIEAYTKGKLKAGDVLNADNVDLVKELLDPVGYWQIKYDRRTVDLIETETDVTKLLPGPYLEATLRNKGVHHIGPDGNVWTKDGKPWIGGNPFPEAKTAEELLLACSVNPLYYDAGALATREWDTTAEGELSYVYDFMFVLYQTVGRVVIDPKPYLPGRENDLRASTVLVTAPEDQYGNAVLEVWPYDQRQFPVTHGYAPQTKRIRTLPGYARFEPPLPGVSWFMSDAFAAGDPVRTWGDFKLVGKGPFLAATHGNCHFAYPNWQVPLCGGKTGKKYFRTFMELVPEGYVVEMKPVGYPNCPYGKKRIWLDARTGNGPTFVMYDHEGNPFHQVESFYDYAVKKPGMEWPEGMPDRFWSFMNMHMYEHKNRRMSRMGLVPKIAGGFITKYDDPKTYDEFCTLEAIRRLGR